MSRWRRFIPIPQKQDRHNPPRRFTEIPDRRSSALSARPRSWSSLPHAVRIRSGVGASSQTRVVFPQGDQIPMARTCQERPSRAGEDAPSGSPALAYGHPAGMECRCQAILPMPWGSCRRRRCCDRRQARARAQEHEPELEKRNLSRALSSAHGGESGVQSAEKLGVRSPGQSSGRSNKSPSDNPASHRISPFRTRTLPSRRSSGGTSASMYGLTYRWEVTLCAVCGQAPRKNSTTPCNRLYRLPVRFRHTASDARDTVVGVTALPCSSTCQDNCSFPNSADSTRPPDPPRCPVGLLRSYDQRTIDVSVLLCFREYVLA